MARSPTAAASSLAAQQGAAHFPDPARAQPALVDPQVGQVALLHAAICAARQL